MVDIKHTAASIKASIDRGSAFSVDAKDRDALLGHFPELEPAMEKWNAVIRQSDDTVSALRLKIETECVERGITESVWQIEVLIPALVEAVRKVVDDKIPNPILRWGPLQNGWGFLNGPIMLDARGLSGEPRDMLRPVDLLFAEAHSWG